MSPIILLIVVVVAAVAAGAGYFIGYNNRKKTAEAQIGSAEAEQPKIFSRFYRSQAVCEEEGVGIGLYLARKIISDQGGYIKLHSEVGIGSTFSVFLPRSAQIL